MYVNHDSLDMLHFSSYNGKIKNRKASKSGAGGIHLDKPARCTSSIPKLCPSNFVSTQLLVSACFISLPLDPLAYSTLTCALLHDIIEHDWLVAALEALHYGYHSDIHSEVINFINDMYVTTRAVSVVPCRLY
ncbi:hypothetical protein BJ742DRAFT_770271 [Cladochytrium replicatum]|nr:hypothetical protein BJ742DRAFT_770271 [Cladochytrium replicatum]